MDESLKEEFKKIYSAFAYNRDEIKNINESTRDMVKTLAKKLEIKPKILNKVFINTYKKDQTGTDEISDVQQIISEFEN